MRTIVTTKNQTTYVVTDRDIIEALVGLGIPRSVLLSADATIKLDWPTMDLYKDGFYFEDADDDTFLTVEGPVEDVKPEPAPEPVKEEVYPNGTVLIGQYTGATYVVIDYYYQTRQYVIESLKDYRRHTEPRSFTHDPRLYKVVQPYPEGTVLIGQASVYRYTVVKYNDLTRGYVLRNGDITTFESFRCVHNPALFKVAPTPAPAPTRLPVGSVVKFKRYDGTEDLCYITGYRDDGCAGYIMWNVTNKFEVWDSYSTVDKDDGPYTVVYTPDPNRNTKPFDGAFPLGTVFKHKNGFTLIVNGYLATASKMYNCYTDRYTAGQEHHNYLTNADVYTVLYTPSEQSKT